MNITLLKGTLYKCHQLHNIDFFTYHCFIRLFPYSLGGKNHKRLNICVAFMQFFFFYMEMIELVS